MRLNNSDDTAKIISLLLFIILIAGTILRFAGITFGLPLLSNFYVRPDETLIVVPAVRLFAVWDYPVLTAYPQLMTILTSAASHLYYFLAALSNPARAGNMIADFAQNLSAYFLVARILSACAGSLTIYLVYALGRETMSRPAGLLAAALFATAPLAVRDAHFGVTDQILTMLAAATAWALIRCIKTDNRRFFYFLLSGCLTGLAVSAKYIACVLIIPAFWTLYVVNRGKPLWKIMFRMIAMGAVAAVVFFAVNYQFISEMKTLKGTILNLYHVMFRTSLDGHGWNIMKSARHILVPLFYGPGMLPGMLLAIAGIWGIQNKSPQSDQQRVLFLSGAGFLAILLPVTYAVPYRYLLPVMPFAALFTAAGVIKVCRLFTHHARGMQAAYTILAAILIIPAMLFSIRIAVLLHADDARTLAGQWIMDNIQDNIPIIINGPPEGEPQIQESRPSIGRRMDYVKGLYGEDSGRIVGEIYDMQYRFGKQKAGHNVYRNLTAVDCNAPDICVVNIEPPFFPSPFKDKNPAPLPPGKIIRHVVFNNVNEAQHKLRYDRADAFFIPFNHLNSVIRPGPRIDIFVIQKNDSGHS